MSIMRVAMATFFNKNKPPFNILIGKLFKALLYIALLANETAITSLQSDL